MPAWGVAYYYKKHAIYHQLLINKQQLNPPSPQWDEVQQELFLYPPPLQQAFLSLWTNTFLLCLLLECVYLASLEYLGGGGASVTGLQQQVLLHAVATPADTMGCGVVSS